MWYSGKTLNRWQYKVARFRFDSWHFHARWKPPRWSCSTWNIKIALHQTLSKPCEPYSWFPNMIITIITPFIAPRLAADNFSPENLRFLDNTHTRAPSVFAFTVMIMIKTYQYRCFECLDYLMNRYVLLSVSRDDNDVLERSRGLHFAAVPMSLRDLLGQLDKDYGGVYLLLGRKWQRRRWRMLVIRAP